MEKEKFSLLLQCLSELRVWVCDSRRASDRSAAGIPPALISAAFLCVEHSSFPDSGRREQLQQRAEGRKSDLDGSRPGPGNPE